MNPYRSKAVSHLLSPRASTHLIPYGTLSVYELLTIYWNRGIDNPLIVSNSTSLMSSNEEHYNTVMYDTFVGYICKSFYVSLSFALY